MTIDEMLDQMMIESFVESVHYSSKLEDINVPLDRCYDLCIGTYFSVITDYESPST